MSNPGWCRYMPKIMEKVRVYYGLWRKVWPRWRFHFALAYWKVMDLPIDACIQPISALPYTATNSDLQTHLLKLAQKRQRSLPLWWRQRLQQQKSRNFWGEQMVIDSWWKFRWSHSLWRMSRLVSFEVVSWWCWQRLELSCWKWRWIWIVERRQWHCPRGTSEFWISDPDTWFTFRSHWVTYWNTVRHGWWLI